MIQQRAKRFPARACHKTWCFHLSCSLWVQPSARCKSNCYLYFSIASQTSPSNYAGQLCLCLLVEAAPRVYNLLVNTFRCAKLMNRRQRFRAKNKAKPSWLRSHAGNCFPVGALMTSSAVKCNSLRQSAAANFPSIGKLVPPQRRKRKLERAKISWLGPRKGKIRATRMPLHSHWHSVGTDTVSRAEQLNFIS